MKTYTFAPISFNDNNTFRTKNNTTNASEILDSIIAANLKDNNKYLYRYGGTIDKIIDNAFCLKDKSEFEKASDFLANYRKNKSLKDIFKLNTLYKINGRSIIFYDDEIQIGSDLYRYEDFSDILTLKKLAAPMKKIIINIYTKCNTIINIH